MTPFVSNYDLLATLRATSPGLSSRLADAGAQRRVAVAAAQLPASLTGCFYLECRLQGANDRLDLIVRVDRAEREVLAGGLGQGDAAWARLARFASMWGAPTAPWAAGLEALWIELDLPPHGGAGDAVRLPTPRIFFDFARSEIQRQRATRGYADALLTAAVLIEAPTPRETAERAERCFAALPTRASLPYVGLTQLDAWDGIRLCVAGVTARELPPILHALDWPGDLAEVQRRHAQLLRRLGAADDRIDLLHLDLAPPHRPARVGLEVATARFARGGLLDALVDEGLCDPARRSDLDPWPARWVSTLPHQIWRSRTTRKINHVKIVHDPDGSIETKAYLSTSSTFYPHPAGGRVALPLHQ